MAQNRYQNLDMAESLLVGIAAAAGAAAAALAVPLPRGVDSLGRAERRGRGGRGSAVALATRGGPRKRAEVASFLAVTAIAVTVAAVAYGYGWQYWVPAGAIAFGLIVVTNAAKLTVAVARIALPPIPAPGETVANDELLDPVVDDETPPTRRSPTWQAIIASVPESAARLTERSRPGEEAAGRLPDGRRAGPGGRCDRGGGAGTLLRAQPVVAGLVATICGFRSRLYAERWCAWALLAAAVVIPTGVMVRLCLWYPASAWLVLGIYCVGGRRGADPGRRHRGCPTGVAGDQADSRTA